jgi:hypothetical protein
MAPKMTKEMAAVSGTVTLQVRTRDGLPWYTVWLAGDDGRGYYYSHINNDTPGTDDGRGGFEYAFAPGIVTGTHVEQGEFIAYCGDSGNAEGTSPHLHFEIHETTDMASLAIDPYDSLYSAPLASGSPGRIWPTPVSMLYDQTSSKIVYTGRWTTANATAAYGGSHRYAGSEAGALIWFQGTGLDLLATKAATQGRAWLSLDGDDPVLVDFYSPTTLFRQTVWSAKGLAPGTHTVELTCAGQSFTSGGGTRVNVDALRVTGFLVQPPVLTTSQQTSSLPLYAGKWTTSLTAAASGGSLRLANSPGASLSVQFTGIYVCWIARKSAVSGIARLTIDGGTPQMVDLYSAGTVYQQKVWNSGILPYGVHRVTIEWTGSKSKASGGASINLDAVQSLAGLNKYGAEVWEGPTAGVTIEPPYDVNEVGNGETP